MDTTDEHGLADRTADSEQALLSPTDARDYCATTVDEVLVQIGGWGVHQFRLNIILGLLMGANAMQIYVTEFSNRAPDAHCLATSAPPSEDVCDCPHRYFTPSHTFLTLSAEFDLICHRKLLANLVNTAFPLGWCVGAGLVGYVADRSGRRPVIYTLACGSLVSTVWCAVPALSPTWVSFSLARILGGVCSGNNSVACILLVSELVDSRSRAAVVTVFWTCWAVLVAALGLLAFAVDRLYAPAAVARSMPLPDWRMLHLAVGAIEFLIIAMPPRSWLCESPRFLLGKGRVEEATEALHSMAAANGRASHMPALDFHSYLRPDHDALPGGTNAAPSKAVERASFARILSAEQIHGRSMWHLTAGCILIFASSSLAFYGLTFTSANFISDIYASFAISPATQLPVYLAAAPVADRLGRRATLLWTSLLGGALTVLYGVIPAGNVAQIPVAYIAIMLIAAYATVMYYYLVELFPTSVRGVVFGLATNVQRGMVVAAPLIQMLAQVDARLPSIVYGVPALLAAAMLASMPETNGIQLQ